MSKLNEPRFFLYDGGDPGYTGPGAAEHYRSALKSYTRYCSLFSGRRDHRIVGEASAAYIYAPQSCERIRARLPGAKLVAIVRQPVDQSYSDYQQKIRQGMESAPSLGAAWADHERRIRENWFWGSYRFRSTYFPHLKRYRDAFGAARFKIFLPDDLVQRPVEMIKEMWQFLEVDDTVRPDFTRRYNYGNILEDPILRTLWSGTAGLRNLMVPALPVWARGHLFNALASASARKRTARPLATEERDTLTATCRDDILRAQDLIGRDLGAWLRPTPRPAPSAKMHDGSAATVRP